MLDASSLRSLEDAASECLKKTEAFRVKRSESVWLAERYENFRRSERLSRAECDVLLYEKTFAQPAMLPANAQRIRFWRTGRYYPQSRAVCIAFARALEMTPDDARICIQAWYDHCDRCFSENDSSDPVYKDRAALMNELAEEFISKIPPAQLTQLCASGTTARQNLRHIYCSKAMELICLPEQSKYLPLSLARHVSTASYTEQFANEMRLLGEIPRNTMIRHLLLLSMPFISAELLNKRLALLGYRHLQENNSDRYGNAVDFLLLRLMELFETNCEDHSPEECAAWLKEAAVWLDQYFYSRGCPDLCLFRFKHLKNRISAGTKNNRGKS